MDIWVILFSDCHTLALYFSQTQTPLFSKTRTLLGPKTEFYHYIRYLEKALNVKPLEVKKKSNYFFFLWNTFLNLCLGS